MSSLRLVCHVTAPDDEELPNDDAHPFWVAIDDLADAVDAAIRARGVNPDAMEVMSESEDGSPLTQSGDTPAWTAYFGIYLPRAATVQAALMPIILDHLSRAHEALPGAAWKVTLGDDPLIWDGSRFRLRS